VPVEERRIGTKTSESGWCSPESMSKVKSNIVLIGMPGCGKSTVGVLLAKRLGLDFVDTDLLIQTDKGMSLPRLIETYGMDAFCEMECEQAQRLDLSDAVIATGGSAVYYECAMRHLQADGVVVYLYLPEPELHRRLGDLIKRGVVLEPGQTLTALYKKRTPLYEQWADLSVDLSGLGHEAAVEAIMEKLTMAE
jgi:shikimate kinase